MDEFDLDITPTPSGGMDSRSAYNNRGTQSRRKTRMVRRHDNPDPAGQTDPFNANTRTADVEMEVADSVYAPADADNDVLDDDPDTPRAEGQDDLGDRTPRRRRAPQRPRRAAAPKGGALSFLFDRRFHAFIGFVAIVVAATMFVVLVSHLRSAAADQSLVINETVNNMAKSGRDAANTGGWFGAWLSHVLFTDAMGVGAFVLVIYLFTVGCCLIAHKHINFWSFTFKSLLLAVTVSVVVGLVTFGADSALLWGGTHGHYVNQYLFDTTDWVGPLAVSLILLAATVCAFYYPIRNACKTCARFVPSFKSRQYDEELEAEPRAPRMPKNQADSVQDIAASEHADNDNVTSTVATPVIATPELEAGDGFEVTDNPFAIAEPVAETAAQPAAEPEKDEKDNDMAVSAFRIDDDATTTAQAEASQPLEMEVERPAIAVEESVEKPIDEGFSVDSDPETEVQEDYDPHAELPRFRMPGLDLLEEREVRNSVDRDELEANKQRIVKTLGDYKIEIARIKATVGPTITLYEIVPTEGTRIKTIKNLEDDIAMSLSAKGIRIIAPMPGKGTIGIEVPNYDPQTVSMRSVLESRKFNEFNKALPLALGATISNDVFCVDLASMPHALVAGATGMGKSVGLNAIIASLLYKKHPADLKFVLIDPKMVEFSLYSKLEKHYLAKLPDEDDAIITDTGKVLDVLKSLCVEMDQRYALLKDAGVREIKEYNSRFIKRRLNPANGHRYLPYIVVIIDEFADLIMTGGKEIEGPVTRITQKARAVGIHMIIATQRPSTNVLTGLIKANCPARVAFRVNQMVDSRTILDCPGANQLIGRGDMLYSAGGAMERVQCAFISTDEVERLCDFVNAQVGFVEPYYLPDPMLAAAADAAATGGGRAVGGMERDPLFDDCARFTVSQPTASTSILQRRFEIGYNRAGKIMDQMEAAGIVGPPAGSKPRQVLVDHITLEQMLGQR